MLYINEGVGSDAYILAIRLACLSIYSFLCTVVFLRLICTVSCLGIFFLSLQLMNVILTICIVIQFRKKITNKETYLDLYVTYFWIFWIQEYPRHRHQQQSEMEKTLKTKMIKWKQFFF